MSRKTAFRGISSLIFVLVLGLTLAGASPAAAAGPGFRQLSLERLASGFWAKVASWLTGPPMGADKRGFGIDPNGETFIIDPDPAAPPAPPVSPGPAGPHGRP